MADRSKDIYYKGLGSLWRRLAETILPRAEANSAVLRSFLRRWWSEEDSKRILRRVVPDMDALSADAIRRALLLSLKSQLLSEIREELKNLVGPGYSADLVRKVRAELFRWLLRKQRDEFKYPRLKTRRCSAAADGDQEEVCSICLARLHQEDEMIATLDCGHGFHTHCITQWLMKGVNVCPLCRGTALPVPRNHDMDFFMLEFANYTN